MIGREDSLGVTTLDPGSYGQVRLHVESVTVTEDGEDKESRVPSDVIRLVGGIDVVAGETTVVTFDFDADRSVVSAGPNLIFKPVVKLLVRKSDEPFVPQDNDAPDATPAPTATSVPAPTATPIPPTPTPTPTPAPDEFVLNISSPAETETIVSDATITVSGQTRADAALSVNDTFLEPDINGLFSTEVALETGPNTIEIVASIASGEEISHVFTVIYIPGG